MNQGLSGVGISNGNTTTPSDRDRQRACRRDHLHLQHQQHRHHGPVAARRDPEQSSTAATSPTRACRATASLSSNWGPVAPGESVSRDITFTVGSRRRVCADQRPGGQHRQQLREHAQPTADDHLGGRCRGVQPRGRRGGHAEPGEPRQPARRAATSSGALTIANVAPGGSFSEQPDASFGTLTGSVLSNGGTVSSAGRRRIEQHRDDAAPGRFHRRREDRHGADQLRVQRHAAPAGSASPISPRRP